MKDNHVLATHASELVRQMDGVISFEVSFGKARCHLSSLEQFLSLPGETVVKAESLVSVHLHKEWEGVTYIYLVRPEKIS